MQEVKQRLAHNKLIINFAELKVEKRLREIREVYSQPGPPEPTHVCRDDFCGMSARTTDGSAQSTTLRQLRKWWGHTSSVLLVDYLARSVSRGSDSELEWRTIRREPR